MTNYTIHPDALISVEDADDVRRVLIETSTSRPALIVGDHRLLAAIKLVPAVFTKEKMVSTLRVEFDFKEEADNIWEDLVANDVVVREDSQSDDSRFGDADFYHRATRSHPFMDMSLGYQAFSLDNSIMSKFSQEEEFPDIFWSLEYETEHPLQKASDLSEWELRLSAKSRLSLLLDGTFGSRRVLSAYRDELWDYVQLPSIAKAVPSGGGRHPTECFAVLFDGSFGTEPGVYHYNVERNSLGLVLDLSSDSGAMLEMSRLFTDPNFDESIGLLLASRVERSMFRYRDSRSFRALLVDAGHLEGHLVTLGGYLGSCYYRVDGWDPEGLSRLLGLNTEISPLLLCGALRK